MSEPCRPFPVRLLPAALNCFVAPNVVPPSVERVTPIGSFPLPVTVADRNIVKPTYRLPKCALAGFLSTQAEFLSLNVIGFRFVLAATGRLQVTPLSSENDTTITSAPPLPPLNVLVFSDARPT